MYGPSSDVWTCLYAPLFHHTLDRPRFLKFFVNFFSPYLNENIKSWQIISNGTQKSDLINGIEH